MAERILIVEDDPATREGLTMLLETLGYNVATAPDGLAALAALKAEPPDVMLLDLILPGDISGIQILQTARQAVPQVGAIVMTGFPSAETTVEALRLGAFDYVTKPFDLGSHEWRADPTREPTATGTPGHRDPWAARNDLPL